MQGVRFGCSVQGVLVCAGLAFLSSGQTVQDGIHSACVPTPFPEIKEQPFMLATEQHDNAKPTRYLIKDGLHFALKAVVTLLVWHVIHLDL